jgi:hypothetical protein
MSDSFAGRERDTEMPPASTEKSSSFNDLYLGTLNMLKVFSILKSIQSNGLTNGKLYGLNAGVPKRI